MARFESEGTWFSKAEQDKRRLAAQPFVDIRVNIQGAGGGLGCLGDYERSPAGRIIPRTVALQAYDVVADMLVTLGGIPSTGVDRHTPFSVLRHLVIERFTRPAFPPPPERRPLIDYHLACALAVTLVDESTVKPAFVNSTKVEDAPDLARGTTEIVLRRGVR